MVGPAKADAMNPQKPRHDKRSFIRTRGLTRGSGRSVFAKAKDGPRIEAKPRTGGHLNEGLGGNGDSKDTTAESP
jgi:hypothetical protein